MDTKNAPGLTVVQTVCTILTSRLHHAQIPIKSSITWSSFKYTEQHSGNGLGDNGEGPSVI